MGLPQTISRKFAALWLALPGLGLSLLAASCGTPGGAGPGGPSIGGGSGETVKVGLLLPMTAGGSTPAVAKALKQAAELALFDFDNPGVVLVPKDTRGTPDGARAAAQAAIGEGAELLVGPLFAQEVTAAAAVTRQAGVPMIAFSSDESVAGNGVYLLSFVAGRDVPRIVSFALSRGKRNFAVLVPQSPYGRLAEAAFAKAVSQGGGQASVRATYPPNDSGAMLGPVRQIANAIKSGQPIDALFIPAGREDIPSLAPLLAQSDLTSARVQFVGTGQWDYPGIGNEKAFVGGWYPAPDPAGWNKFAGNYSKTYGDQPPRLASLA
jgi:ABC-type branched-subunit amino acid transport system substrate-binding protein